MKNKKVLSVLLASAMALSMFSAVNVWAESNADLSGEVRFAYWAEPQTAMLEEQVAAFNEIYPNVNVKLELTGWNDFWMMLETAVTGGTAADVFWLNVPNFGKYASAGILLPLDDYIAESGIDLANYPQKLINAFNYDGVQYGIPKDFDTTGVFYNKDLFDKYGVEYPTDDWTWDELAEKAVKLTDPENDIYGFCIDPSGQYGTYATVPAAGGYILSDDKKSCGYNTPEGKLGLQVLRDLVETGASPTAAELDETDRYSRFLNGKVAMMTISSNYITDCAKYWEGDLDHLGTVALPSINGHKGTVVHGLINAINANTENPDACWAWVDFLSTEPGMEIACKYVTASLKGYGEKWAANYPGVGLECFVEMNEYASPYPGSLDTEWSTKETDIIKEVLNLEKDVDTACAELQEVIDACLASE